MSKRNLKTTSFLPAITALPALTDVAFTSMLDLLFEPSDDLHLLALSTLRKLSFTSYSDLVETMGDELLAIAADSSSHSERQTRQLLRRILCSHPRLGEPRSNSGEKREEKENIKGELSAQSAHEQKHLRGGDLTERERLAALNAEYEERFPGLRYVVFVNGRGRDVIMEDMRRRIGRGNIREEEREAIRAMCDIAKDRAAKLLAVQPAAAAA